MDVSTFGSLSPNIDDRRGDSALTGWAGAIKADFLKNGLSLSDLKLMLQHPLTPWRDTQAQQPINSPVNPLGVQAGMLDIDPSHRAWIAQRLAAEQAAVQANPNVHSFDEQMDPGAAPVSLDRRKM